MIEGVFKIFSLIYRWKQGYCRFCGNPACIEPIKAQNISYVQKKKKREREREGGDIF
jgi:hypothetical protein